MCRWDGQFGRVNKRNAPETGDGIRDTRAWKLFLLRARRVPKKQLEERFQKFIAGD